MAHKIGHSYYKMIVTINNHIKHIVKAGSGDITRERVKFLIFEQFGIPAKKIDEIIDLQISQGNFKENLGILVFVDQEKPKELPKEEIDEVDAILKSKIMGDEKNETK